jgi:hypothetical protein
VQSKVFISDTTVGKETLMRDFWSKLFHWSNLSELLVHTLNIFNLVLNLLRHVPHAQWAETSSVAYLYMLHHTNQNLVGFSGFFFFYGIALRNQKTYIVTWWTIKKFLNMISNLLKYSNSKPILQSDLCCELTFSLEWDSIRGFWTRFFF